MSLAEQISALESRISNAEQIAVELTSENKRLRKSLTDSTLSSNALPDVVKRLEGEKNRLQANLADLQSQNDSIRKAVEKHRADFKAQEDQLRAVKTDNDKLRKNLNETITGSPIFQGVEKASLVKQRDRILNELNDAKSEVSRLSTEVARINKIAKDNENTQLAKISDLTGKLKAAQNASGILQTELQEARMRLTGLQRRQAAGEPSDLVKELRSELGAARTQLKAFQDARDARDNRVGVLTNRLETAEAAVNDLRKQLDIKARWLSEAVDRKRDLNDQLATANGSAERARRLLEKEREERRVEIEGLQMKLDAALRRNGHYE